MRELVSGGEDRASLSLRAASGYPQIEILLSGMLISFLSLHREDDDHLWEPFNAEVLARHDIELSQDDLDDLAGDEQSDREGEICPSEADQ